MLNELSLSKYVGDSFELPFFPLSMRALNRTVALSSERPRKFDPLVFGSPESFTQDPHFFSPGLSRYYFS